jgi:hypothetical protein
MRILEGVEFDTTMATSFIFILSLVPPSAFVQENMLVLIPDQ